jgi:galactokinase
LKSSGHKIKTPARICLYGDHQDYLGLPVIACAINRFITLEAQANGKDYFHISMPDTGEERSISIYESFTELKPRDYFGSAIRVVRSKGVDLDIGFDIIISGNIPINSGLSSSTAVCLAWIEFLIRANSDWRPSPNELARLSHHAEVLEHGEPGGMMDQYSIAHQGVIYLDTKKPYQVTTLDVSIPGLVIGDSGIVKKTIDVLREARDGQLAAIDWALKEFNKSEASELTLDLLVDVLPQLPENLRPYLRAAIGNHTITTRALEGLNMETPDWKEIGALMNQHQVHLRDDLHVSIPALDAMISAALEAGALGAKLVGSGGGGCVLALAPEREEEVRQAMLDAGAVDAFSVKVVHV